MARPESWPHRLAHRAGLSIERFPPPGSLSRHLAEVFAHLGTDLVIDVGAHEGGYVARLREEVRWPGRVVSFEPASISYQRLLRRFGDDPAWTGHQLALGHEAGRAELRIFPKGDLNSLLEPSAYGLDRYQKFSRPEGTEEVEVRTISDIFDDTVGAARSVFLKVDTQGSDLDVVEGAGAVLDRSPGLQVEVAVKPLYEGAPALPEVLTRLGDLGYELTGLFPVSRAWGGVSLVTVDGVFCRS